MTAKCSRAFVLLASFAIVHASLEFALVEMPLGNGEHPTRDTLVMRVHKWMFNDRTRSAVHAFNTETCKHRQMTDSGVI